MNETVVVLQDDLRRLLRGSELLILMCDTCCDSEELEELEDQIDHAEVERRLAEMIGRAR